MTQCTRQLRLSFHPEAPVVVEFDAPEISSDGGALLLRQLDDRLGLTAGFSKCLLEDRDSQRVRHSRQEQVRPSRRSSGLNIQTSPPPSTI